MTLTAEEAMVQYAKKEFDDPRITWATIDMDVYEGYDCCGGNNPSCYCSFAESGWTKLILKAHSPTTKHERVLDEIYGGSGTISFASVLDVLLKIGNETWESKS